MIFFPKVVLQKIIYSVETYFSDANLTIYKGVDRIVGTGTLSLLEIVKDSCYYWLGYWVKIVSTGLESQLCAFLRITITKFELF